LKAVVIDRGEHAEVIASMILLRAIDKAVNVARPCSSPADYSALLEDMISETHQEMHPLWNKKEFMLEPEDWHKPGDFELDGYHVTTVREFLLALFGDEIRAHEVLDAITNASHFVTFERFTSVDADRDFMQKTPKANN
jgi:hypothetical protein